MELVGHVAEAWIHPVKGMRGQKQQEITVRSVSVVGDRRVAFAEIGSTDTPSVIDTIKFPGLLEYLPFFVLPKDPARSPISIITPDGRNMDINSQDLLTEISNRCHRKLTLVRMGRALYHSMPVSLLSFGSIGALRDASGENHTMLNPARFRENLVVDTESGQPFTEDSWLGQTLIFGEGQDAARLVAVKQDERCGTIDLNPSTGISDRNLLKTLQELRGHINLGIYCTIVEEGTIREGDPIYLL